jgi:hypothetical protein
MDKTKTVGASRYNVEDPARQNGNTGLQPRATATAAWDAWREPMEKWPPDVERYDIEHPTHLPNGSALGER